MNKIKNILFFISFAVIISFFNLNSVFADTFYATETVKVRNAPNTSQYTTTLGTISPGGYINSTVSVPTNDSSTGCSTGLWYKISYNGNDGYTCTNYFISADKYNRPWTTPKKAIVGGAKFISSSYISVGQFTSYLKKFNVNPASTNAVYTHQYMTNIRAPYSEAYTSYIAYRDNNLLNQSLVFTIPIFNNMPDYTTLPGGVTDTSGQSEITDATFEAALNAQGFPESYKVKLRSLHNAYPNWIFESLKTNLNWNTSVNAEQPVCSIDGTNTAYRYVDSYGNYVLKEGSTWFLPNTATTAYFLDPRNFLKVERILMFEKLAYSSNQTASVLQTRLNSTHMSGNSIGDGQSYASIFVEAGQANNVSSIYLVSLALQETGSNGSMATTGECFSYNGVTYQGLYNFFNIGAVSSAASPVRAGLVWANGGATSTVVTACGLVSSQESTYINSLGLTLSTTGYITGTTLYQTAGSITGKDVDVNVSITDSKGNVLSDNIKIYTGANLIIKDATNTYIKPIAIYGDLNGDGDINAIDLLNMRKHLLKTIALTGANLQAAKIAKGTDVGAVDLLYLRRYLLDSNTYKITQ